jgi:hypothetical protein
MVYSGIWVGNRGNRQWAFSRDMDLAGFSQRQEQYRAGFRPVAVAVYKYPTGAHVCNVTLIGPDGHQQKVSDCKNLYERFRYAMVWRQNT